MKKGSPEWMRAKYSEMMVAHLSIFENEPAEPTTTEELSARDPDNTRQPDGSDQVS